MATQKVKTTQFDLTKHIMFNVNLDNSGLLQREYDVLLMLSAHRNHETGACFPGKELLANECHIKIRTVDAAINGLESKGWLTYKRGGLRGNKAVSNDYVLNVEKIMSLVAEVKLKPDTTIKKSVYVPEMCVDDLEDCPF